MTDHSRSPICSARLGCCNCCWLLPCSCTGKNGSKPCHMEDKEYWVLWVHSVRSRLTVPLDPLQCPMLVEEFRSPLELALRAREAPVYHQHETLQPLPPLPSCLYPRFAPCLASTRRSRKASSAWSRSGRTLKSLSSLGSISVRQACPVTSNHRHSRWISFEIRMPLLTALR